MKTYNIYNFVRVDVDDSYSWNDTLFLAQGMAEEGTNIPCEGKILIRQVEKFDFSTLRFIGDDCYVGTNVYFDKKYGVCLQKISDNELHLIAEQECNEWLIIALELLLLQQKRTLLHAAAVENGGDALVMPSWGGVGKTAIVCKFVKEHGWKLLGDDLVIIDQNNVHAFLKPFVIYPYHKNLFPDVFSSNPNHIVKNLALSNLMSKAIPTVKRALRPFPFLLAFLRKHNPQSMRVSPLKIFSEHSFAKSAVPKKVVWLDRTTASDLQLNNISVNELTSRAATITSVELFSDKLCNFYHLCGCGIFNYDETIGRIHEIITDFCQTSDIQLFQIPTSVSINDIGEVAYKHLH